MTTYTQEMLYEKIYTNRRVTGGTLEAAIAKTQKQLQPHAAEIWKDRGFEFLRWLEQKRHHHLQRRAFRNTEDGGHTAAVVADQNASAPGPSEPDWEPLTPEVAEEIEHGDQLRAAIKRHQRHVPAPASKPGVPWMLRQKWSLDAEVSFAPTADRRQLGETDDRWWAIVENFHARSEVTHGLKTGAAKVVREHLNGQKFSEMVQRLETKKDVLALRKIRGFLTERVSR